MTNQALILVDLQNDFCPGGALPVRQGDQIISLVNAIQKKFKMIIATQDWHPPGHKSFASTHHKKPGERILLNGLEQILWPDHCVQGTHGAEFAASLDASRIHKIFKKGTDPEMDSYSGFFDNGHLKATGLGEYLRKKEIQEIFIAGLATDYCVKSTALDGVQLGFKTAVIEDACRGVNLREDDIQRATHEMQQKGVKVLSSASIFFKR